METDFIPGERVLSKFEDKSHLVALTNFRVIKRHKVLTLESFQDMHYKFIESIEYKRQLNVKAVEIAGFLLISGVVIAYFLTAGVGTALIATGIVVLLASFALQTKHFVIRGHSSEMQIHPDKELIKKIREYQSKVL